MVKPIFSSLPCILRIIQTARTLQPCQYRTLKLSGLASVQPHNDGYIRGLIGELSVNFTRVVELEPNEV